MIVLMTCWSWEELVILKEKRLCVLVLLYTVFYFLFLLFSLCLFFMQLYLKICHLLTVVLGMLPGMAVGLGICPNPVKVN